MYYIATAYDGNYLKHVRIGSGSDTYGSFKTYDKNSSGNSYGWQAKAHDYISRTWDSAKQKWDYVYRNTTNPVKSAANAAKNGFNAARSGQSQTVARSQSAAQNSRAGRSSTGLGGVATDVGTTIGYMAGSALNAIESFKNFTVTQASSIFGNIINAGKSLLSSIGGFFTKASDTARAFVSGASNSYSATENGADYEGAQRTAAIQNNAAGRSNTGATGTATRAGASLGYGVSTAKTAVTNAVGSAANAVNTAAVGVAASRAGSYQDAIRTIVSRDSQAAQYAGDYQALTNYIESTYGLTQKDFVG